MLNATKIMRLFRNSVSDNVGKQPFQLVDRAAGGYAELCAAAAA